jgi:hypothetical protein
MPQETGSHDDLEGKSLNTKRIEKKKKTIAQMHQHKPGDHV